MDVQEALVARRSIRAFQQREVDPQLIEQILASASHAPSGVNTQPWQVAVVTGTACQALTAEMELRFREGEKGKMDYQYYPLEWQEPYKGRRRACGLQMYETLQITREDKARQLDQWAANYRAFDAPVILFFLMNREMETGSYLDYGMFLQSVMLAAQEQGLSTCPQAALAEYPEVVKRHLGYDQDTVLVAGMALGYAAEEALINSYRTPREPVENFTRMFP
ncbi:MAG: nitroreductase [Gammaproteobacteria bacterium]|jgi:nitroreductase|nr:nitroreductase [Gammaproteobacteria bacterium]MBT3489193.1 nitroreductase [Gammaproteobacteria bacterium]MBT3718082.1 nitroreductase [Gammaproteobacteria bacterium]MBT3845123.1 nitroreductase [Gammaproteobacteria bacterium]MBT3893489.1 nitroreductase [Gammaproteobacteria bacterium]